MKTIIWKELRENIKWSVLALLCLGIVEIYTLSENRLSGRGSEYDLTICSSTFLMVTSFGCSVIGAALGAIQILPELRRDQWAALLHRPVSRSVIFFGKVSAGLLLYFLATIPPLAASVVFAASPGQFAGPLVPSMLLPAASDLFLGMTFYFAALLVSLTRGRWHGRRGLLIIFLLPVFVSQMITRWIFFVPIGASLVLLAAACGVMMGNGIAGRGPKAGRIAFVFVTLVSVEAIIVFVDWSLSLLSTAAGGASEPGYRNLELTKDGQILVQMDRGDGSVASLTDIQGKPVADERYFGNNAPRFYPFTMVCQAFDRPFSNADLAEKPRDLRNYVELANSNADETENWFQISGENYFVGYDKLSRRRIGICDREGFHPVGAQPKPFPTRLQSGLWSAPHLQLYWSGGQMYGFDFAERVMTPLFNAGGDTNHGFETLGAGLDKPLFLVVALEKSLRILDLHGSPLLTIPYSHDPRIWTQILVGTIPSGDRVFVRYDADYDASKPVEGRTPSFVEEIDLKGNVLHSYSFPANSSTATPTGWTDEIATFTLPFGPIALYSLAARMTPTKYGLAPDSDNQALSAGVSILELAILGGISAALAIVTLFWAGTAGFSREKARGWGVFVFCFGLPGFITFRVAAEWPTRVRCPHCRNKRPVEAEECPSCRGAWAPPARNGAEIFDLLAH